MHKIGNGKVNKICCETCLSSHQSGCNRECFSSKNATQWSRLQQRMFPLQNCHIMVQKLHNSEQKIHLGKVPKISLWGMQIQDFGIFFTEGPPCKKFQIFSQGVDLSRPPCRLNRSILLSKNFGNHQNCLVKQNVDLSGCQLIHQTTVL